MCWWASVLPNGMLSSRERDDDMLHEALYFAARAHDGQRRKGTDIPYIVHPYEVAQILMAEGAEEEVIIAGLLHDTVEDTSVTLEDIRQAFGEQVALMVLACSENKEESWEERKQHTIRYVKMHCPYEVMLIVCADKLSNLRSIRDDLEQIGESLWERFHRGRSEQRWYYESLLEAFGPLEDTEMCQEYQELVLDIFGY